VIEVVKEPTVLWTDAELVSAVDAYVFLLQAQRAGLPSPKEAGTRLLLSGPLNIRNDASLRYRMRNISAVISEMGVPSLSAYTAAEQVGTNVRKRIRAILAGHSQFKTILEQIGASESSSKTKPVDTRTDALERLARLRIEISELEREITGVIGIGHNQPPEPLSIDGLDRVHFEQARKDILALEEQLTSPTPNANVAKEHTSRLLEFGLKVALWVGERATKFTDVTLAFLAPVVVAKATGLAPVLMDALRAVAQAISF
jgi:hypothetical protein